MPNQIKDYVIECFKKNLGVEGLTHPITHNFKCTG